MVLFNTRRVAHRSTCCLVLLAFLYLERPAHSQGNQIVEMSPEKVRHLAGVVTDTMGDAVFGATVEDRDSTFSKILATCKTDENGRFSFPKAKRGVRHYLQAVSPGFDLMRIPVSVGRIGKDRLVIRLVVGT
jgi:hypothetical protein